MVFVGLGSESFDTDPDPAIIDTDPDPAIIDTDPDQGK